MEKTRSRRIGPSRIPVQSITLTLAEGPLWLVDRPRTYATFKEANGQLSDWRLVAPTQGYWKTDFVITFADGETYRGRYDLARDQERSDWDTLGEHVRRFLGSLSGRERPSHLTADDYMELMGLREKRHPGMREEAARLLDTYDI